MSLLHGVFDFRPKPAFDPRMDRVLANLATLKAQVLTQLEQVLDNQEKIMATLQDISDAETAEGTAIQTVLTNLATLKAELATAQANGADPVAMQAIVDKIHANTALLTGALPPAVTTPVVSPTTPDTTPATPPAAPSAAPPAFDPPPVTPAAPTT